MAKIKTPLLRPLRQHGATLYTFPSASEDISLNINSSTQGVSMSHYALLNFTNRNFKLTNSLDIALSLQNWLMNSEVVLLNQPTYNFQENKTVSERVFWNWANAMSDNNLFDTANPVYDNIYREKNYKSNDIDRLVQCFGAIDSGNHLSTEFGMFNEVYVNVPTSYGNGPVFFESVPNDSNYSKNVDYTVGSSIEGRTATDKTYLSSEYPLTPLIKKYRDNYGFEIVKDTITLTKVCQELTGNKFLSIGSFDDMNIDATNQFMSLDGLNINNIQCQFKFNAILLYYSIYDLNDINKDAVATNLFGIVFLDGGAGVGDNDYLLAPVLKKKSYKSQNSSSSYFGNGYSFRVNIKTLSVYDNTDAVIEDNTTSTSVYSQDFNDVISNLNKAIDLMNTNVHTTSAIQDRYMEMCTQYVEIQNKFKEVQDKLVNEVTDRANALINEFTDKYQEDIERLRADLGLDNDNYGIDDGTDQSEETTQSSNQTLLLSPIMNHLYPELKANISNKYGSSKTAVAGNSGKGLISDTKVNVHSATDVNLNAADIINLTAEDVKFNFKSLGDVSSVKFSAVIDRINKIESDIADIKKAVDVLKNENKKTENVVVQEIKHPDFLVTDIIDVILPRAKKPDKPGIYFKQNTAGNITQIVTFNGETYDKPIDCVPGKLYSMNGLIYVFNNETCKPIGSL